MDTLGVPALQVAAQHRLGARTPQICTVTSHPVRPLLVPPSSRSLSHTYSSFSVRRALGKLLSQVVIMEVPVVTWAAF